MSAQLLPSSGEPDLAPIIAERQSRCSTRAPLDGTSFRPLADISEHQRDVVSIPQTATERSPTTIDEFRLESPDDQSWLADAIDPNCPCHRDEDTECCNCGSCIDDRQGRPEGVVGVWPPDEYICDGGDRETRVVVNPDLEVSGLDLEDTIAHYDTLDGRTIVTPSNNVCIYAPRFAAVRKIVRTSEDDRLLIAGQLEQPLPPFTDEASQRPNLVDQPLPPLHDVGLKAPIALRYRTRGVDLVKTLPVLELVRDFEAYEDLQIIRLGIHRRSEQPLLLESAQAAQEWTDNLAPEVILDEEPAEVDVTVEKPEAVYHVDQGPPRLRVIKVASCCSALPGEEITFTLRFDNIGRADHRQRDAVGQSNDAARVRPGHRGMQLESRLLRRRQCRRIAGPAMGNPRTAQAGRRRHHPLPLPCPLDDDAGRQAAMFPASRISVRIEGRRPRPVAPGLFGPSAICPCPGSALPCSSAVVL